MGKDNAWRYKPAPNGDRLSSGEFLAPGRSLLSSDGRYRFAYQYDGNLVLYRTSDNLPVWDWGCAGTVLGRCELRFDGSLVVIDAESRVVRASPSNDAQLDYTMIVESVGTVAVYAMCGTLVWETIQRYLTE